MSTIIIDLSCFFVARIFKAWEIADDPDLIPDEIAAMSIAKISQTINPHANTVIAAQDMDDENTWQCDLSSEYCPRNRSLDSKVREAGKKFIRTIEKMGVTIVRIPGRESDDVAAMIARRTIRRRGDVTVVSNSLRLLPLMDRGIHIREPFGKKRSYHWCRTRYGIEPLQMPDYLALVGCRRFKGVPGIGEKRAKNLLRTWNNIETIVSLPSGNDGDINRVKKYSYQALIAKVMAIPV